MADPDDVTDAVKRASEAQKRWADRTVAERGKMLWTVSDLVLDHRDRLLDTMPCWRPQASGLRPTVAGATSRAAGSPPEGMNRLTPPRTGSV